MKEIKEILNRFEQISEDSFNELSKILVVPLIDIDTNNILEAYQFQNSFQYCIQLMSIPEYQLC